jgi:flagellar basal body-associated protein FliL
MADEKKPAEGAAAEAPKQPKIILGFPLPIFILIALNLLVMSGGLGYLTWFKILRKSPVLTEESAEKQVLSAAKPAVTTPVNTGIFTEVYPERTINLRSARGGTSHYVTVEVAIECGNEECQQALKAIRAKVEDTIQSSFAQKSYTELSTVDAKFRMRHQMLEKINSFLLKSPALDLYFSSLIIQ